MMLGGRQAFKTKSQSKKFQAFNKAWDVGDKLSVFFPIFFQPNLDDDGNPIMVQDVDQFGKPVFDENGDKVMVESGVWDIVTADIWGHQVSNLKEFPVGGAFIPSLTEIVRGEPVKILRNEDGSPMLDMNGDYVTESIPGDITYQFSKIAPLFVEGEKQQELARVEEKKFTDESLKRSALETVKDKYDTQKNMFAPRAIVGKLQMAISTEVFVVKYGHNDSYDISKAQQFTYKLSEEKFMALVAILDDNKFKPRDRNAQWIEVVMTFNGNSNDQKDRGAASRKALPTGLTEEYTMAKRDPDAYSKIKSRLMGLPRDSQTISRRNFMYQKISEKKIQRCISSYITMKSDMLDYVKDEENMEIMMGMAHRLVKFNVLDNMKDETMKAKILESYAKYVEKHPELEQQKTTLATETPDYAEPQMDVMPTSRDLLGENFAGVFHESDDEDIDGITV